MPLSPKQASGVAQVPAQAELRKLQEQLTQQLQQQVYPRLVKLQLTTRKCKVCSLKRSGGSQNASLLPWRPFAGNK